MKIDQIGVRGNSTVVSRSRQSVSKKSISSGSLSKKEVEKEMKKKVKKGAKKGCVHGMVGVTTCVLCFGMGMVASCKKKKKSKSALQLQRLQKMLPVGNSSTRPQPTLTVSATHEGLYVGKQRVAAIRSNAVDPTAKKNGKKDEFKIQPLYKKLKKAADAQKKKSEKQRSLALKVHRDLPYRVITEILYTAMQAGFSVFQLVVRRPDGSRGVIVVLAPRRNRSPRPRKIPVNLTVIMVDFEQGDSSKAAKEGKEGGYFLKSYFGSECPPKKNGDPVGYGICFSTKEKGRFTKEMAKKLQHHMWYLFAKKFKSSRFYENEKVERHEITLVPQRSIKYKYVIQTLDALREIPTDATNPKSPSNVPADGCRLTYDRSENQWMPKHHKAKYQGCMYHRVILAVGAP
jgi:biopolymer transport protein ExbD